jgi:hypothetical protein
MSKLYKELQFDNKKSPVYVPNEIFTDLKNSNLTGSSHIAFAYSYYYLMSWLYRYGKYGQLNLKVDDMKQLLGYSPSNRDINYIIKKNGILDQLGYTYSSTDYPISWNWNNGDIEFTLLSDLDEDMRKILIGIKGKNYKVKVPVKGLFRSQESEMENYLDGTFYDISHTHLIPFEDFIRCMDRGIGVIGFYLYGYMRCKCQWHEGKYNSSVERIAENSGISVNTVDRYLSKLIISGLVKYAEGDCKKIDGEFKRDANTYKVS